MGKMLEALALKTYDGDRKKARIHMEGVLVAAARQTNNIQIETMQRQIKVLRAENRQLPKEVKRLGPYQMRTALSGCLTDFPFRVVLIANKPADWSSPKVVEDVKEIYKKCGIFQSESFTVEELGEEEG